MFTSCLEFPLSSWMPDCEIDVERCDCLPRPEPTVYHCHLNSSTCAHKNQRFDQASCRYVPERDFDIMICFSYYRHILLWMLLSVLKNDIRYKKDMSLSLSYTVNDGEKKGNAERKMLSGIIKHVLGIKGSIASIYWYTEYCYLFFCFFCLCAYCYWTIKYSAAENG